MHGQGARAGCRSGGDRQLHYYMQPQGPSASIHPASQPARQGL
jgi:hypothetical protein